MNKHISKPWIVFHGVEIRCPSEDNTVIARMEDSREAGWSTPTINANARLIASAPCLYQALVDCVKAHDQRSLDLALRSDDPPHIANARQLLQSIRN